MFLLRRKSDGKYFRNKGYHQDSSWRKVSDANDPRWREDPNECIPFATVSGMKNSRGVDIGVPFKTPTVWDKETRDAYWTEQNKWYAKSNTKVRRQWEQERFDKLYEVVPITFGVSK